MRMMRAIVHTAEKMLWQEVPAIDPVAGAEVLVEVFATAVNRADLLQRAGKYPPPPGASPILGLEVAGKVKQVGPEVRRWKVGDRVMGLLAGGGYAEEVKVHESHLMPVPAQMRLTTAAAAPEVRRCWLVFGFSRGVPVAPPPRTWVCLHGGGDNGGPVWDGSRHC